MWLNVRNMRTHRSLSLHTTDSTETMFNVTVKVTKMFFNPTGYENVLYAMIFVPIVIVLLICLLGSMLVILNRKRCVFLSTVNKSAQLFISVCYTKQKHKMQKYRISPSNQTNLANLNKINSVDFLKILNQCSELLQPHEMYEQNCLSTAFGIVFIFVRL